MKLEYPFTVPAQMSEEKDEDYVRRIAEAGEAHLENIQRSETKNGGKPVGDGLIMNENPAEPWEHWKARMRAQFLKTFTQ